MRDVVLISHFPYSLQCREHSNSLYCVLCAVVQSREGLPITVSSKAVTSDSGIQPDTVEDNTAKESSRVYVITKNTILAEMKTLAKYDRKVLEMGSKAFMSFLKVCQCVCPSTNMCVCLPALFSEHLDVCMCVCASG